MSLLRSFVVPMLWKSSEKSGKFLLFHAVFNRVRIRQGDILQTFPHLIQFQNFLLRDNTFFFLSPRCFHLSTDFSTPCGKLLSAEFQSCRICPVFWGQPMTFQRHFNDICQIYPCHPNKLRFERIFFMDFLREILPF